VRPERIVAASRAAARLAKALEVALGEVDLSLPQYRLLALLSDGSAAAAALADRLAVSRPSVTALVDGLVQRGLVQRQPDPEDRRRVGHVITPAGRAALHAADGAIGSRLTRIASLLEEAEATAAVDGLATWLWALDAAREQRVGTR
jgi:long-chain acyl-CoA synthetase